MANGFLDTIEACDKPCAVCGRTHRKLKMFCGVFAGSRCIDNVRFASRVLQSFQLSGKSFADFVTHIGSEMGSRTAASVLTFINNNGLAN